MEINNQSFNLTEIEADELWNKVNRLYHENKEKVQPQIDEKKIKSSYVFDQAAKVIWNEKNQYFTKVFGSYAKYLSFLGLMHSQVEKIKKDLEKNKEKINSGIFKTTPKPRNKVFVVQERLLLI